ncbi:glycosyltransferase [Pontibacter akesuensis]|nr:glycosyltransferase [Pontibacter akesuensis]
MKILQLIQKPQPRGAETFAAQLSDNLEQQGHSSKLFALFDSGDANKFNRSYVPVKANASTRLWDKKGWRSLANIITEENPDVIQANAGDTLKYAVFSKLLYRWRQPIVFRNASTLSSYLRNPLQKFYTGFLLSQVDAIASVSEHSKQDLVRLFPKLVERIITIPIGLEEKAATSNPFPAWPNGCVNLVHVGGFSFEKNHKGLLRIFKKIVTVIPSTHLWLVGDGPLKSEIEALVKDLGLKDKVTFTGFVQNPLDYTAHGDALLLPSIIEGLPGVILEAMLYETPVVATKVGGVGEVVISDETGWLVDKGDEAGFADAVSSLLENSQNTGRIVSNASSRVKERYMNQDIARLFINLYHKLL